MATLQIDLPDSQIAWIEDHVSNARSASPDEYISDLIRRDQERKEDVAAREVVLDELVEDAQKNDMGIHTLPLAADFCRQRYSRVTGPHEI